jgi:hypothetical protein
MEFDIKALKIKISQYRLQESITKRSAYQDLDNTNEDSFLTCGKSKMSIKLSCWCKKHEVETAVPIKPRRGKVLKMTALVFGETFFYKTLVLEFLPPPYHRENFVSSTSIAHDKETTCSIEYSVLLTVTNCQHLPSVGNLP